MLPNARLTLRRCRRRPSYTRHGIGAIYNRQRIISEIHPQIPLTSQKIWDRVLLSIFRLQLNGKRPPKNRPRHLIGIPATTRRRPGSPHMSYHEAPWSSPHAHAEHRTARFRRLIVSEDKWEQSADA